MFTSLDEFYDYGSEAEPWQIFTRSSFRAPASHFIKELSKGFHNKYFGKNWYNVNEFLYLYPSEFDITYYTGGMENPHLHKHTSCVLEEMTVNYTPNGNFAVFSNGMPTQINVSLTFKELQILSKETVAGGL